MNSSTVRRYLYYPDTKIPIKLGDIIEYRKIFGGKFLLFGKFRGVVSYVPGESLKNSEMEFDNGEASWAIRLDGEDESIIFPYFPDDGWVTKRIKFINRGEPDYSIIKPDDKIWGIEEG